MKVLTTLAGEPKQSTLEGMIFPGGTKLPAPIIALFSAMKQAEPQNLRINSKIYVNNFNIIRRRFYGEKKEIFFTRK